MSPPKNTIRFQNSKVVQTVWNDYFSGNGKALRRRKGANQPGMSLSWTRSCADTAGVHSGDRQAGIGEETQVPWKVQSYRWEGR